MCENLPLESNIAEPIPPSKQALAEALALSSEILDNIEKNETPLTNVALKPAV